MNMSLIPQRPGWRDIPMVLRFFLYLFSETVLVLFERVLGKKLREYERDYPSGYFDDWPSSREERGELADEYTLNACCANVEIPVRNDYAISIMSRYQMEILQAVSMTVGFRVQDLNLAKSLITAEDFNFEKFKSGLVSSIADSNRRRAVEELFIEFTIAWGGVYEATKALYDEFTLEYPHYDASNIIPMNVKDVLENFVKGTQETVRQNGGDASRLFPYP